MNDETDESFSNTKEEYKKRLMEKQAQSQAEQETAQKIDALLRSILETAAKERLSNVRLVNPELYMKATQAILFLAQNKQFSGKISGEQLKQILQRLSQKRETSIKRK
ncbi:MAG: hypothetical protein J4215_01595 [Candidatus Diapherotrites archaeon]|uniref:DNA-binding protein n=1 Tax=Candidatus Iainarchaeum sp. TaxID=3101447 RepID=A0A8T4LED1_9ARCH|nr:hypothetical protein [Candidatus Diapherotrites archaeon]